jgi:hypothetical protein
MSITVANSRPADYTPCEITSPKAAMTASLHILFNHVADFHQLIVKIIAEKYEIPEDEILKTITEHPDYVNMTVHPIIQGLSYITQEDVPKNEIIEPPPCRVIKFFRKKKE